jgi:hypothetical protein
MKYVQFLIPKLTQVPQGQDFNVTIGIVDPWKHHIENASISLNLSHAPGISFLGGTPPVITPVQGSVQPGSTDSHGFDVTNTMTEIHVTMVGDDSAFPGAPFHLHLKAPNGHPWNGTAPKGAPPSDEYIHLTGDALQLGGTGKWTVTVDRPLPHGLPSPPLSQLAGSYKVVVGGYSNVTGVTEIYLPASSTRVNLGQNTTVTFRLHAAPNAAAGTILYKLKANMRADVPPVNPAILGAGEQATVGDHQQGHPPDQQDLGLYYEWHTMPAYAVGPTLVETYSSGPPILPPDQSVAVMRGLSYALGYGATFSLIPALVLGGTFGSGTVAWLNKYSGGARRRVLWHNAASFTLLATASIHMLLFLYEPESPWTSGAIWGTIALASLALLGVTGALQRWFVERWGFAMWRYMHFGIAILSIAFTVLHLGIDGTHFAFLRNLL